MACRRPILALVAVVAVACSQGSGFSEGQSAAPKPAETPAAPASPPAAPSPAEPEEDAKPPVAVIGAYLVRCAFVTEDAAQRLAIDCAVADAATSARASGIAEATFRILDAAGEIVVEARASGAESASLQVPGAVFGAAQITAEVSTAAAPANRDVVAATPLLTALGFGAEWHASIQACLDGEGEAAACLAGAAPPAAPTTPGPDPSPGVDLASLDRDCQTMSVTTDAAYDAWLQKGCYGRIALCRFDDDCTVQPIAACSGVRHPINAAYARVVAEEVAVAAKRLSCGPPEVDVEVAPSMSCRKGSCVAEWNSFDATGKATVCARGVSWSQTVDCAPIQAATPTFDADCLQKGFQPFPRNTCANVCERQCTGSMVE